MDIDMEFRYKKLFSLLLIYFIALPHVNWSELNCSCGNNAIRRIENVDKKCCHVDKMEYTQNCCHGESDKSIPIQNCCGSDKKCTCCLIYSQSIPDDIIPNKHSIFFNKFQYIIHQPVICLNGYSLIPLYTLHIGDIGLNPLKIPLTIPLLL